ncbi:DoxX family protein [Hymenobacter cellulosivorans]|uniref:DoxX family protein n=1 Tax=Hymenobacter cellulosivorans TaxID=2932249 RepID=A0ABY4F3E2_9BACT|nr:DoxX family protein [Hymenobacter cellulosivorans]UOQ51173.1 DoxX family protein [Hymenobacter cellulosivorans]
MSLSSTLDTLHGQAKRNQWLRYFTIFNRVVLAMGFLPSGYVKIIGERFTNLVVSHPMGHYLEAFHRTGFYYPFVGVMQMTAAVLLLIPRTATLGAVLYFPIILNIFVLTISVRFVGSLLTSPLMVLANLYLLCWDYDKLKYIFPFQQPTATDLEARKNIDTTFPTYFFAGVFAAVLAVGFTVTNMYSIQPYNNSKDCKRRCEGSNKSAACYTFCDCIHQGGQPINKCLDEYNNAPADAVRK